jgi:hypothetical protein
MKDLIETLDKHPDVGTGIAVSGLLALAIVMIGLVYMIQAWRGAR